MSTLFPCRRQNVWSHIRSSFQLRAPPLPRTVFKSILTLGSTAWGPLSFQRELKPFYPWKEGFLRKETVITSNTQVKPLKEKKFTFRVHTEDGRSPVINTVFVDCLKQYNWSKLAFGGGPAGRIDPPEQDHTFHTTVEPMSTPGKGHEKTLPHPPGRLLKRKWHQGFLMCLTLPQTLLGTHPELYFYRLQRRQRKNNSCPSNSHGNAPHLFCIHCFIEPCWSEGLKP